MWVIMYSTLLVTSGFFCFFFVFFCFFLAELKLVQLRIFVLQFYEKITLTCNFSWLNGEQ